MQLNFHGTPYERQARDIFCALISPASLVLLRSSPRSSTCGSVVIDLRDGKSVDDIFLCRFLLRTQARSRFNVLGRQ